jgi:hypothetical protein
MDKIIKIVLGLLIILLVVFAAVVSYFGYIDNAYRNSLTGTYQYTCTISTDDVLSNVTLFIPVPADPTGNSPVVTQISNQALSGVPGNMNLTLYDTGKATLLKVSAQKIGSPGINGTAQPTVITFAVNVSSPGIIDTNSPVQNAAVFHPIDGIHSTTCPAENISSKNIPVCYQYLTDTYADYSAAPSATMNINASVTGTNTWTIFAPGLNQYQNQITVLTLHGANHGWVTTLGWIESGIGSYDVPSLT